MTKEKFLKDMRRHSNYFNLDVTINDNVTFTIHGGRGGDITFCEKGASEHVLTFSFSFGISGAKFGGEPLFGDLGHEHYVPYSPEVFQPNSVGTVSREVERFLSESSQMGRKINEAKPIVLDELRRRGELRGKDIKSVSKRRAVNPALEQLKRDQMVRSRTGPDRQVYWSAVDRPEDILAELRASGDMEQMCAALQKTTGEARDQVIAMLGQKGDARGVEPLLELVTEGVAGEDRKTVEKASRALRAIGPVGTLALTRGLTSPVTLARWIAADVLADVGTAEAIPALKKTLEDRDEGVREAVSVALERVEGR